MKVRNLIIGEQLPEQLRTGYEGMNCMPEWIFVAERDGEPVAILVAAPVHIVVLMVRLCSTPEASPTDVRALLVHFVKTVKERGYGGYITYLSEASEVERTLSRIITATGGVELEEPQRLCVGVV